MIRKSLEVAAAGLALALVIAGAPAGQAPTQQVQREPEVSLSADLVEVPVMVVDSRGRPMQGLGQADFEVFDNGVRQQVAHFSEQGGPLNLGVVFDATGMPDETVGRLLGSLRRSRIVTELASEVFCVAFNEKASTEMGFVGTRETVLPELRFTDPRGPLGLRGAMALALSRLETGRGERTVVLVVSEGNTALEPRGKTGDDVEHGGAQVYAVFPTPVEGRGAARSTRNPGWQWWLAYTPSRSDLNLNRAALADVARSSGGRALYAYAADEASCDGLFAYVAGEIASQYTIAFYPSSPDSGWHRIAVRLAPGRAEKGLDVSHRSGYRRSR
jgi:VWFA-related protein